MTRATVSGRFLNQGRMTNRLLLLCFGVAGTVFAASEVR